MTADELRTIYPNATYCADAYAEPLTHYMSMYGITTLLRQCAFLATIGEESGELHYTREIWGPTTAQGRYEPPNAKAAELGNTEAGDGYRYRGRGLIQITGRANYAEVGTALGVDFIAEPEKLEQPEYATESACWWWKQHGCNELADTGSLAAVTRRVNGGLTHLDRRKAYYDRAYAVLTSSGDHDGLSDSSVSESSDAGGD